MRLNGITAESGTIIGYHVMKRKFLTVISEDENGCVVSFSTPEDRDIVGTREPRSVVEHHGIRRRMTPYGLVRMYGPRPLIKPKVVGRPRQSESYFAELRQQRERKRAERLLKQFPKFNDTLDYLRDNDSR